MEQPTNNIQPEAPKVRPICPKCGAGTEPPYEHGCPVAMTNLVMGPAMCAVVYCGACGVIISVQVLEMATMGGPHQPPPSRLVVPS